MGAEENEGRRRRGTTSIFIATDALYSAEDTKTKAPIDPSSKVDTAFGLNIPTVAHYVGTKQKQTFSGENGLSVL